MDNLDLGQEVDKMLDTMLTDLGIGTLDPEKKTALKAKLKDTLIQGVIATVVSAVPSMTEEEIKNLDQESFDKLLQENDLNLVEIAIQEGTELREDLRSTAVYAQGYLDGRQDSSSQ